MSRNCKLGRGPRSREKNAADAGVGRFEKPAPDARAAPPVAHESLISRKTVAGQFNVGGQTWQINYTYVYDTASPTTIRPLNFQADYLPSSGTQKFLAITAVPEPATWVLGLAGLACGGYVVFRRRKRP